MHGSCSRPSSLLALKASVRRRCTIVLIHPSLCGLEWKHDACIPYIPVTRAHVHGIACINCSWHRPGIYMSSCFVVFFLLLLLLLLADPFSPSNHTAATGICTHIYARICMDTIEVHNIGAGGDLGFDVSLQSFAAAPEQVSHPSHLDSSHIRSSFAHFI